MSATELFKALGHPVRLEILKVLGTDEQLCVNDVAEKLSVDQTNASHHLIVLLKAGAVEVGKSGNRKLYKAKPGVLRVLAHADELLGL